MSIAGKIRRALNPCVPVRQLYLHRSLWQKLIARRLTQTYRGSTFGWLWNVIQPIFLLLVYTYVFREVFKVRWGNALDDSNSMFAITMFSGLTFFNFFSEALNSSTAIMENNVNFVKKAVFPLELLPLTQCAGAGVSACICFLLAWLGNICLNGFNAFSWSLLAFPFIFFAFFIFTCGLSLIVASLGVYFRDTRFFCMMLLQVLFFITPIFYPVSAVPQHYRWILEINPFSWFVDIGRNALLYGIAPSIMSMLFLFGLGFVVWQLGWGWFSTTGKGFADVL